MSKCDKKCKCDECKDSLKINIKNDYLSYKNCCVNQKLLKNEYYLQLNGVDDGYFDCGEVLEKGYFTFDGYLSKESPKGYFNFGRTGNTEDWQWTFEIYLFYGVSPNHGKQLLFTTYTTPYSEGHPFVTSSYVFYNVRGFFNYRVEFDVDQSELHYINNVLMFKSYYNISGQARGLNLYASPGTGYYNNLKIINNDKELLNVNMKKMYGEYLNVLISEIPNFFLKPWVGTEFTNSFIKKNISL